TVLPVVAALEHHRVHHGARQIHRRPPSSVSTMLRHTCPLSGERADLWVHTRRSEAFLALLTLERVALLGDDLRTINVARDGLWRFPASIRGTGSASCTGGRRRSREGQMATVGATLSGQLEATRKISEERRV